MNFPELETKLDNFLVLKLVQETDSVKIAKTFIDIIAALTIFNLF